MTDKNGNVIVAGDAILTPTVTLSTPQQRFIFQQKLLEREDYQYLR